MNELLRSARASVRAYLAAIEQDQVTFARRYAEASEACSNAGVSLAQVREQLMAEERAARVAALIADPIADDEEDEIPPLAGPFEGGTR